MKLIHSAQTFDIPEGVRVDVKSRVVSVEGKHGKLTRCFKHVPCTIKLLEEGKKVKIEMWFATMTQQACVQTLRSHITNMCTGVSKKFQYKMRLVYAHFPISTNVVDGGKAIELRNFLGEKRVRVVKMLDGVVVDKSKDVKDELVLSGCDIEKVSRSAALIHQATLVHSKDIRKFLDGIYVSEKGTVEADD